MKLIIFSGTPKTEGLCVSLVAAAKEAGEGGGAEVSVAKLCESDLRSCAVCNDGWGTCRPNHTCIFENDGFGAFQEEAREADALILITPVYWGEMSEAMKDFIDRLRRCEATRGEKSALHGKKVLLVASAGGSGNGLLTCLEQLERAVRHMGGQIFDYVGVNRWNAPYKTEAIKSAVALLVDGLKKD